ncbi:hypothetical protein [Parahalioglobus pacificus]|uniref:TauD/TfdA-like domain-containing protein n=1 Tax=Parahalioglobus pacificus TaxID=930806 RepID=A0A918XGJ5_9GAMM|nr:hypothetical protein [Halioglobus pacificus]GHD30758.1 hypothetical protein GCM10007053_12880 [Halioglobus pacificus]
MNWSPQESQSLLGYLHGRVIDSEFTGQFIREPGSVTIWDGLRTEHYAMNDCAG